MVEAGAGKVTMLPIIKAGCSTVQLRFHSSSHLDLRAGAAVAGFARGARARSFAGAAAGRGVAGGGAGEVLPDQWQSSARRSVCYAVGLGISASSGIDFAALFPQATDTRAQQPRKT